jgi:pimeloyl-ACP methyl ester carboxylesterase
MDPEIRYVRNDDVAIAYQVVGDGDRDLILVPDFISNLVYGWESPYWREFYERLSRSFRLILFDKRGTGLSDRGGAGFAALETRMDDMRAVLEAVGRSARWSSAARTAGRWRRSTPRPTRSRRPVSCSSSSWRASSASTAWTFRPFGTT